MKYLTLLLVALFSHTAFGQSDTKQQLASHFYDSTTGKQTDAMANAAAKRIIAENPNKVRQAEIYRQWATETFGSIEYKNIYVQFLIENFSVEELAAMNKWAEDPNFLGYMNKWQSFPQWSAPKFQEFLKIKNPELMQRLRAEGFDPNK